MIRLHVTAEGQTEQSFVKQVLSNHLAQFQVYADARCVLTSKDKRAGVDYRGGLPSYEKAKRDIMAWLKEDQDPSSYFTTMFDLYALPDDFPGYEQAKKSSDPYERVRNLEVALQEDMGSRFFIPYIQLHEFEALILSDAQQLDWEYLEHQKAIQNLVQMVGAQNPELINDGATTAPSKRIIKQIAEYNKVTAGVSVVGRIGLPKLRQKCRHFDEWLVRLEKLG